METFAPEDILVENLSFTLNKGASYITDRRRVTFWPSGSNIYKPSSGSRVLKVTLNGEENTWLDPQSVRIFFTLNNTHGTNFKKYALYRRLIPFSDECELLLVVKLLKILIVIPEFITCLLN